jgi:hypothetical protein
MDTAFVNQEPFDSGWRIRAKQLPTLARRFNCSFRSQSDPHISFNSVFLFAATIRDVDPILNRLTPLHNQRLRRLLVGRDFRTLGVSKFCEDSCRCWKPGSIQI